MDPNGSNKRRFLLLLYSWTRRTSEGCPRFQEANEALVLGLGRPNAGEGLVASPGRVQDALYPRFNR